MGKRGPPPKPTALKVLEGNPGQRPLKSEPEIVAAPKGAQPPSHLSTVGKAEWRRMFPVLRNCGLLTVSDLPAFGTYCALYARFVEAEAALRREDAILSTPNGHKQPNPWITISRQTAEQMKAYLIEFGMTPAARARMGSVTPPPADKPDGGAAKVGGKFEGLVGRR